MNNNENPPIEDSLDYTRHITSNAVININSRAFEQRLNQIKIRKKHCDDIDTVMKEVAKIKKENKALKAKIANLESNNK